MQIGFIGLGRMGRNMAARLVEKGHTVIAFDVSEEAKADAANNGVATAASIAEVVNTLTSPKIVWVMVQRKDVESVLAELTPLLSSGDTIIDGGNSFYQDSISRFTEAKEKNISFVDVGVSGGVDAARDGACLMVGGEKDVVEKLLPVFESLAQPGGFAHAGGAGAGHFVKMVHNGIEYGMMQALGEGLEALARYEGPLSLNIDETLRVYTKGSIIEGKLTQWLYEGWHDDPKLKKIEGTVPPGDTEAEMESLATLSRMPALELSIAERKRSRTEPSMAGKAVAIMRNLFGGHRVEKRDHA